MGAFAWSGCRLWILACKTAPSPRFTNSFQTSNPSTSYIIVSDELLKSPTTARERRIDPIAGLDWRHDHARNDIQPPINIRTDIKPIQT